MNRALAMFGLNEVKVRAIKKAKAAAAPILLRVVPQRVYWEGSRLRNYLTDLFDDLLEEDVGTSDPFTHQGEWVRLSKSGARISINGEKTS